MAHKKKRILFVDDDLNLLEILQQLMAQSAGRTGEEAFNHLLSLSGGEFDLLTFTEPPEQTISGSWEFLLMEAARQREMREPERAGGVPGIRVAESAATLARAAVGRL